VKPTIPFNKPYLTGNELGYVQQVLESGHLCGNGPFTKRCQQFLQERYGFKRTFLTASCTDALEMCAILAGVEPGDEVILPSYTFVSTATAFALRGAVLKFADSQKDHPNVCPESVRSLIGPKTKAIVAVHYAGVACPMDEILEMAQEHNLVVVEDAAQAIDSYYKGKPLGSIGHLAAFSFHETKNIQCGQGGLAVVNDAKMLERAEYVWEKGTNRSRFVRGQVDKYGWVDIGSSYLPGESVAALLWAQLEQIDSIQKRRREIWDAYLEGLKDLDGCFQLPPVPDWATVNGHLFHLVFESSELKEAFQDSLREQGVQASTHYLSLHRSAYYQPRHDGRELRESDRYTECLIRLPLFAGLTDQEVGRVIEAARAWCKKSVGVG